MIAGVFLVDSLDEDSSAVFLGDEVTEVYEFTENSELVEFLDDLKPEILALNSAMELTDETERYEEELSDQGFSFTPASHEKKLVKRIESLKRGIKRKLDSDNMEIIRYEPQITADELAIHGDEGFESYGIDASVLDSSKEFNAMLGAVTARFYQENSVRDHGIIVPGGKQ